MVDLTVPGSAEELMSKVSPQWVFHLAAYGAYSWQTDPKQICETNLGATVDLVDAAERHGIAAFVHAGSSSEYGFKQHPACEHERIDPNSIYAVAKAAATAYCGHRAREGRLPAVTLRLYSVYGDLEDSRRLIAALLTNGLKGRLPPLVSPDTARDFVYVADVCRAFMLAAERASDASGEIYNVGSGQQTTLRELVQCSCELFGIVEAPSWGSYSQRTWDTNIWCADIAQIARGLGWSPVTCLAAGLRKTLESMTENLSVYV